VIRTLWRRLFPPGGDVAVAREPSGFTLDIPPKPQRKVDGSFPGPADLSPDGWCWAWNSDRHHWALVPAQYIEPTTPWLPYQAIADPDAP